MPVPAASLANLEKRPRGRSSPNKFTASIKEMVERALHKAGGVDYLTEQAHKNPIAFMGLIGRVLPLQVTGENGGALLVDFRWADAPVTNATNAVADETTKTVTIEAVDTDVVWSDGNEC